MVARERLSDIREVIHMTIREELEKMERETLSPYATLSVNTKGREREEEQCRCPACFSARQGQNPALQGIPAVEE